MIREVTRPYLKVGVKFTRCFLWVWDLRFCEWDRPQPQEACDPLYSMEYALLEPKLMQFMAILQTYFRGIKKILLREVAFK